MDKLNDTAESGYICRPKHYKYNDICHVCTYTTETVSIDLFLKLGLTRKTPTLDFDLWSK